MKRSILVALISSLLAVGIHFYLARRSYALQVGTAGQSAVCSISEKIQCDGALVSPFAKIFGMSISNLGFSTNLLLALVLIGLLVGFLQAARFWRGVSVILSLGIAGASLVMMAISLKYQLLCPLCWLSYLLSFVCLGGCLLAFYKKISFKSFLQNYQQGILSVLFILGSSWLLHKSFQENFGIKNLQEASEAALLDWAQDVEITFTHAPLFVSNSKASKIVLVEFADFLCPHCRNAVKGVKSFLRGHRDVQFHFYLFPLDKTCNSAIPTKSTGLSCKLSKFFICAVDQGQGKQAHDLIFANQDVFRKYFNNIKKSEELIGKLAKDMQLNVNKLKACRKSEKTNKKLQASIQASLQADIQGTPTFYMQGRAVRADIYKISYVLSQIHAYIQR